jgi:protein involved in polysaccharide export with SLBB domain
MISCVSDNSASVSTVRDMQLSERVPAEAAGEHDQYILQYDDVIDIKFYYDPELNETVTIRPDGRISLQIIDEVKAAGLTPSELDSELTTRYSRILKDPQITVIVKEFAGQRAYVGGEVNTPKVVPLARNMSALQAILHAGGFRESAYPKNVIIISRGIRNEPEVRKVNLRKVISGEYTKSDIILRPYDIVYVPKSHIANLNKFVDQYINRIVPDFINAGFSYSIYRGKQSGTLETVPTD